MQINFDNKYNQNFKAIKIASTAKRINGVNNPITIYQLTKDDISVLKKWANNISYKKLFPNLNQLLQERWQQIFDYCIREIEEDSDGSYLAVSNNKPCGILTYQYDGNGIYIDGICSVPIKENKKVPNVGKALFCQMFNLAHKEKCKKLTLSAVQDGPFDVVKKYEELGFKKDITSYPYAKMACNKYEIKKQYQNLVYEINYKESVPQKVRLENLFN